MSEKQLFNKAYVEITDICNLNCSFCKGTDREKMFMSPERFRIAAEKLRKVTQYIYLHVLGEPTLHPNLGEILDICRKLDFKVIITTNGTLLEKTGNVLLGCTALHKVNISLHAFEANDGIDFEKYLDVCFDFGRKMMEADKICVFRLWNGDANGKYNQNTLNGVIMQALKKKFPHEWKENTKGFCLGGKLFLEHAQRFEWREKDTSEKVNCYGLRDQIGVLCDGRIVPCCIDCDGAITLGNIFKDDLMSVITSERAREISDGFRQGRAVEEYCKRCGFVRTRL